VIEDQHAFPITHNKRATTAHCVNLLLSLRDHQISKTALVDTGSTVNLLPISIVPTHLRHLISPKKSTINGVGELEAKGEIFIDIFTRSNYRLARHVKFAVVESRFPIILGTPFLNHQDFYAKSYTITHDSLQLTTRRDNIRHTIAHTLDNVQAYTARPSQDFNAINSKAEWLLKTKEIVIPSAREDGNVHHGLADLIYAYNDVFCSSKEDIGTYPEEVSINTEPGRSKYVRQHPIPAQYEEGVATEITRMLKKGIIRECRDNKGWHSPIHAVEKKNGSLRIVCNFKPTVNKLTTVDNDAWEIPKIDLIMANIGRKTKYFSSLDVASGYWHLPIKAADQHKTAFSWRDKQYMFCRLPFGLDFAGFSFCKAIAKALDTIKNRAQITNYIDDLLIHSETLEDHLETLDQLFCALRRFGIKLGSAKCKFAQKEVQFMGRLLTRDGVKLDPQNYETIQKMKPPTTRKSLQSAIGNFTWINQWLSANYGEPVAENCCSQLLKELHNCTRGDKRKFKMTREALEAFENAKSRISSDKVFGYADFSLPFILICDASTVAMGGLLVQIQDSKQRIIAAASKSFTSTEQKWAANEREAYAILTMCERFDYYLRGPRAFTVLTDHRPLTALDVKSFGSPKLARWQLRLQRYRMVIQYIKGSENVWADLLSRPYDVAPRKLVKDCTVMGDYYTCADDSSMEIYIPSWTQKSKLPKELILNRAHVTSCYSMGYCFTAGFDSKLPISEFRTIEDYQSEDPSLSVIRDYLRQEVRRDKWTQPDGAYDWSKLIRFADSMYIDKTTNLLLIALGGNQPKVVLPQALRNRYISDAHQKGHFGVERTLEMLRWAWWIHKTDDIRDYVSTCEYCAKRKGSYIQPATPQLKHVLRGQRPMDLIYVDYVHMPQGKTGKRYILTIQCGFSRFLFAVPQARNRSIDAARGLYNFMLQYGFPSTISSDKGRHFIGEVLRDFTKLLNIRQNLHCAFRPQSSGTLERIHRVLKNSLWGVVNDQGCDWEDALPSVVSWINRAPNKSIKSSPWKVIFGRDYNDSGLALPTEVNAKTASQYARQVRNILSSAHKMVRIAQQEADSVLDKKSPYFNPITIVPGDEVYVKRDFSAEAKRQKQPYIGPYLVQKCNDCILFINMDGRSEPVHRSHVVKKIERSPTQDDDVLDLLSDSPPVIQPNATTLRRSSRISKPVEKFQAGL
jgi:hypothetical protein